MRTSAHDSIHKSNYRKVFFFYKEISYNIDEISIFLEFLELLFKFDKHIMVQY